MKRFQLFSLASAMLLASAAGFTSCSSDSIEPTGGSGVAGQVVKTQFVINIPYAGNESGGNARVSTRMTAENTQNSNNFLGLKDIEMFAFDKAPTSESNTISTRTIRIGTRTPSSDDNYRRIYSDIAIPVGTTNMILYARASKIISNPTEYTTKDEFQAGSLTDLYRKFTEEATPNLSDLNFNLEAIHKNNDFDTKGQAILERLNKIATTSTGNGTKWSDIGTEESANNDDKILHTLYNTFIKLTAGSANSVNSFINHLKAAIESQGVKTEMANAIIANCVEVSGEFPRDLSLPDGVVRVKFDTTNGFMFETATAGTTTTGSDLIDYKTVTYPSELAYFVSSPIKTSTTDKSKVTDLPEYKDWLAGTETWDGYGDIVQNSTHFVALQNPVQYGVACLKSSIKCSGTSLEDNAKVKISSESNNIITVNDNSFPVTGILIGGQPAGVKWDFEPASSILSGEFKYTIYDKDMNGGKTFTAKAVDTTTLPYNYTLVLDNKDTSSEGAKQSNVNVVIELENKAGDFYGADGLIPKGSKFYLAGTLDLSQYYKTEDGTTLDHVFIKDHTTIANFTIKDLKKAYNCIPDLRTSKINVGLAVDLKWESGIKFDVNL